MKPNVHVHQPTGRCNLSTPEAIPSRAFGPRSSSMTDINASRARRAVELIYDQPDNVRQLALEAISRACDTNPAALDMALDDPVLFIRQIRESIEPAASAAAPPPRGHTPGGHTPTGSRTRVLMGLLRSEPIQVRELALEILLSDYEDGGGNAQVDHALGNPRAFIQEMRVFAQVNVQPGDVRPSNDARQPASQNETSQPQSSALETLEGLDPDVFHNLPDDIRAELLSIMPSDPQPPRRTPGEEARPAAQTARPEAGTASASSPSPPDGETVEEVSWPRILDWLRSRTGPRPVVNCVWCAEEVVISEGNLQPENGEREPSLQLPCSHIVGERCFRNSLQLYGVRVDRCPYCRAEIGDFFR